MLVKIMKPDFEFGNENGSLVQLVRDGWKQVNVLYSKKDSERGGHYHKICNEAFYIVEGKIKLILENENENEESEFEKGDMFMITPFLKHIFIFLEDTIMVSMYDKGVELEDGGKDIYV